MNVVSDDEPLDELDATQFGRFARFEPSVDIRRLYCAARPDGRQDHSAQPPIAFVAGVNDDVEQFEHRIGLRRAGNGEDRQTPSFMIEQHSDCV